MLFIPVQLFAPFHRCIDEPGEACALRQCAVQRRPDNGRREEGEVEVLADRAFAAAFALRDGVRVRGLARDQLIKPPPRPGDGDQQPRPGLGADRAWAIAIGGDDRAGEALRSRRPWDRQGLMVRVGIGLEAEVKRAVRNCDALDGGKSAWEALWPRGRI